MDFCTQMTEQLVPLPWRVWGLLFSSWVPGKGQLWVTTTAWADGGSWRCCPFQGERHPAPATSFFCPSPQSPHASRTALTRASLRPAMGEQVQRWTPGPWPAAGDGGGYRVATLCVLSCSVIHETLRTTANICPWDSPGKKTRVGCHALLQGILPIQGSNPCLSCLLHWQAGSLPLVPPRGAQRKWKC